MITKEEVCCERMWYEIELFNKKELTTVGTQMLESSIWYEEDTRSYILMSNKTPDDYMGSPICFRPFCGKKLPEPLDPEDTIIDEYGPDYVKYTFDPKYKELPPEVKQEFKTDEWWKKRGL